MADEKRKGAKHDALTWIAYAMYGGLAAIVVLACAAGTFRGILAAATSGLLVAGAAAMAGGLLGFMFGIPRALQAPDTAGKSGANGGKGSESDEVIYRANTNLEQISDWLTKILVGVGLTQLNSAPAKFKALTAFLAPAFDQLSRPDVVAGAVAIYFGVSGFLFFYLCTRLFLGVALREADAAALGRKISELEEQSSRDAAALTRVQKQLNTREEPNEADIKEMHAAIAAASASAKTTIFYQAREVRSRNWQHEKAKMERTIPIFRALLAAEGGDQFHTNHGQLGYALKDQQKPDWAAAEKELSEAIRLRGDWRQHGWVLYEFNRAVCRIQLEAASAATRTGESPHRNDILSDLRVAAASEDLRGVIKSGDADGEVIREWLRKNKIPIEKIESAE